MSRLFDMGLCEPMRKMQTNMEGILHVETKFIISSLSMLNYFRYVIVEVNKNRFTIVLLWYAVICNHMKANRDVRERGLGSTISTSCLERN